MKRHTVAKKFIGVILGLVFLLGLSVPTYGFNDEGVWDIRWGWYVNDYDLVYVHVRLTLDPPPSGFMRSNPDCAVLTVTPGTVMTVEIVNDDMADRLTHYEALWNLSMRHDWSNFLLMVFRGNDVVRGDGWAVVDIRAFSDRTAGTGYIHRQEFNRRNPATYVFEEAGEFTLLMGSNIHWYTADWGSMWRGVLNPFFAVTVTGDMTPEPTPTPPTRPAGQVGITINGVEKTFNPPPMEIGGRMMLPFRAIGEALGMEVRHSSGVVYLTAPGVEASHVVHTYVITVNGEDFTFDAPSTAVEGRLLMPLRMFGAIPGINVRGDSATRTAVVTTE